MQPIKEPLAPFYIIILNFILALLSSYKEFDYILLVIKKVNKKHYLILGKTT
jgi:hypothetical protein